MKKASFFCLLAVLVSLPLLGFNAQNFRPASDSDLYLGVYGSRLIPKRQFSIGFMADYAHEPVILDNAAGAKLQNLIDREISAHLTAGYGILPWLDAGLIVSTAPYLVFRPADNAATGVDESATTSTRIRMGDIGLNARFLVLDKTIYPVGLAVLPFVTLPSGSAPNFVGNSSVTGGALVVVESKRIRDRFSVSFNAGYEIREAEALSTQTTINDLFLYGLAGNLSVLPQLDLITEIRGFTPVGNFFTSTQRPLELEAAGRYFVTPRWAVSVGGGTGFLEGAGNPVFRVFSGIAWVPARQVIEKKEVKLTDSDGDGVPDSLDRCPTEVGPATEVGCPPQPKIVISPEEYRILTRQIHFDVNRATLKPHTLPILNTLAAALKVKTEILKLSIQGHCDERGSDAFNQKLSEARASMVRDYLIEEGVAAERLEAVGIGESRPIDPGHNEKAWSKNRRVEFVFKQVEGLVIPEEVPPSLAPVLPEGPIPHFKPPANPGN